MVSPSPWPLFVGLSVLGLTVGATLYMHAIGFLLFVSSLAALLFGFSLWWRDVLREAGCAGCHTYLVQIGLKFGFLLFIVSEVMFFFAFFWAFFHSALSPSIELGCTWPPAGVMPFDPWSVPFLNTCILLLSGSTVTAAHHYMMEGNGGESRGFLLYTLILALLFTSVQLSEYYSSSFSINDGAYGSTFFMATGFHGLHVMIGTCFLAVCYFRMFYHQFIRFHHVGFEASVWYWHFVDVVWLFLFVSIYWWGGS